MSKDKPTTKKKKPISAASTYRWSRRNRAKANKQLWRELTRTRWNNAIFIPVPD